jgi:hypothetical protein
MTHFEAVMAVEAAGCKQRGIQKGPAPERDLLMFDDPLTMSTLALPIQHCTVENVKAHVEKSRRKFGPVS